MLRSKEAHTLRKRRGWQEVVGPLQSVESEWYSQGLLFTFSENEVSICFIINGITVQHNCNMKMCAGWHSGKLVVGEKFLLVFVFCPDCPSGCSWRSSPGGSVPTRRLGVGHCVDFSRMFMHWVSPSFWDITYQTSRQTAIVLFLAISWVCLSEIHFRRQLCSYRYN